MQFFKLSSNFHWDYNSTKQLLISSTSSAYQFLFLSTHLQRPNFSSTHLQRTNFSSFSTSSAYQFLFNTSSASQFLFFQNVFKTSWRPTKWSIKRDLYAINKSKSASDKSISNKSISDESTANPRQIQNALIRTQ